MAAVGQTVGAFVLERIAGSGGMGTVYKAHDCRSGERVAIKLLRRESAAHAQRFLREAGMLQSLQHPRIVRYIGHGETEDGSLYLAMEWLEGPTLADRLKEGTLELEDTLAVAKSAAEALAAAHGLGVVHRDVKPGNFLLVEGAIARLKLLDFGLARAQRGTHNLTRSGDTLGTPGYMSPEQARGDEDIDARADVFSLGCLIYACMTGRPPFVGPDVLSVLAKLVLEEAPRLRSLRPDAPAALDELVARMLEKERGTRPANAGEALGALTELTTEGIAEHVAPVAHRRAALTRNEQRVLALVIARPPLDASERGGVTRLARAVGAHGGAIERLADGSLLVTTPQTVPELQALRAARCAIALRAALPAAPVSLAVGSGRVADGVPMGDVIDRAAVLLRHGDAGVRVDDVAASLLRGRLEVMEDEHGLLLQDALPVSDERVLLGIPTRCVGRNRELANLEGIYEDVISEPMACAVLVTGVAGIGKSRLRYELVRRLGRHERPPMVWIARGAASGVESTFGLLGEAMRDALAWQEGSANEQRLVDTLGRQLGAEQAARSAPFIGEMMGVAFPDEYSALLGTARQDPTIMADQLRHAWLSWTRASVDRRPLLIVLDDLHWADAASLELVRHSLLQLARAPLLVLALARPEIAEKYPDLWNGCNVERIELGALRPRSSSELVRQVLGADASETLVARLVERAGGNAFFLEELIRGVVEGKTQELPESMLLLVQTRLESLAEELRRALRAAAVFGSVFWAGAVASLLAVDGSALEPWLAELCALEIIAHRRSSRFAAEDEYVFRHAELREGAYRMLTDADRILGHRLARQWLEGSGERDAMVLADHLERAGERERSVVYFSRAALQSLSAGDAAGALVRATRAIDSGADGEDLVRMRFVLARAHRWLGQWQATLSHAREAMAEALPGTLLWYEAATELTIALRTSGDGTELSTVADAIAQVLPQRPGDAAYLRALARAMMVLSVAGSHGKAHELATRLKGAVEALALAPPYIRGVVSQSLRTEALYRGQLNQYLEHAADAALWFERSGDLGLLCNARAHLGYATLCVGEHRDAEQMLREALVLAERAGRSDMVLACTVNLGLVLARRGNLDEALALQVVASKQADSSGHIIMGGAALCYRARIHLARAELDEASRLAEMAVQIAPKDTEMRSGALAVKAAVQLAAGRVSEALETSAVAMNCRRWETALDGSEVLVPLVRIQALLAAGETLDAKDLAVRASDALRERASHLPERLAGTYLSAVPDNASLIAIAQKLCV